jgi:hypothetical protein
MRLVEDTLFAVSQDSFPLIPSPDASGRVLSLRAYLSYLGALVILPTLAPLCIQAEG